MTATTFLFGFQLSSNYMLGRTNRFHGHNSVRRVYKQGKPVRSDLFSMHTNTNERVKTTKVAVVVSKKVHKSAVKRNRIRRRIYEQIRARLGSIQTPTEIVVTVYKPEVVDMPSHELDREISAIFQKSGLN